MSGKINSNNSYRANIINLTVNSYSKIESCSFDGNTVNISIGNSNVIANNYIHGSNVNGIHLNPTSNSNIVNGNVIVNSSPKCVLCDGKLESKTTMISHGRKTYVICGECADRFLAKLIVLMDL